MVDLTMPEVLAFGAKCAAIEREACAEVADFCKTGASVAYSLACDDIAALIRARGQA